MVLAILEPRRDFRGKWKPRFNLEPRRRFYVSLEYGIREAGVLALPLPDALELRLVRQVLARIEFDQIAEQGRKLGDHLREIDRSIRRDRLPYREQVEFMAGEPLHMDRSDA